VKLITIFASCALIACGPSHRDGDRNGDGVDAPGGCVASGPEVCNDGIDNDCDGLTDCGDPECSGIDGCPVCGTVMHPEGQPLALPDDQLHAYSSSVIFQGFADTQTFDNPSNLVSVCVTMEHTWIRDLEIDLVCPNNLHTIALNKFLGRTGSEVYLGEANDNDDVQPVPGVGAKYCWTPTATNPPMLVYANMGMPMLDWQGSNELPPGDYSASVPWTTLMGCKLNGQWTIKVQDLWAADNGYIFDWSISFDPMLVQDCSGPVIQ